MKKRNNVIGLLMDKVPRRNKEGYTTSGSMEGHMILVELSNHRQIAEFVDNHAVFRTLSGLDRSRLYQDILANVTEYEPRVGYTKTLLLKIRILIGQQNQMYTPLAWLGTRYARMFMFVTDGAVNPKFDRGQESPTMDAATFLELAPDMPMLVCSCPDDLSSNTFDYAVHGVHVE